MLQNRLIVQLTAGIILAFAGCKQDKNDNATVRFHLTDAPAFYDALYLDIGGIEVHSNTQGWTTLQSSLGIIDLLSLVNGKDTLIASGYLSGTISQIRLKLGANNNIVVNGTTYPLDIPSGEQSGLKMNLHQELLPGQSYEWIIDFDAARSIIKTGADQYKLKPVLRIFARNIAAGNATVGSIYGAITPITAAAVCAISAAQDTTCTLASITGGFLIQGLQPGVYTVVVTPQPPLNARVINNVSVVAAQATDLGLIGL